MKSLGVLLTLLIFLTLTTSTSAASTLYDLRVKNIEGKEVLCPRIKERSC